MKSAVFLLVLLVIVYGGVVPNNSRLSRDKVKEGLRKYRYVVEVVQQTLWYFRKHVCYGAIIDGQYILAPAQCVKSKPWYASFMVVVANKAYLVTKVVVHEQANNIANDIAVLRLRSRVEHNEVLQIHLPAPNFEYYLASATLYRRGEDGGTYGVEVDLKSLTECTDAPGPLTKGNICAGDSYNTAVKGDGGSVLAVLDILDGFTVIGLASFTKAQPAPAVFTKISQHIKFITENTREG